MKAFEYFDVVQRFAKAPTDGKGNYESEASNTANESRQRTIETGAPRRACRVFPGRPGTHLATFRRLGFATRVKLFQWHRGESFPFLRARSTWRVTF